MISISDLEDSMQYLASTDEEFAKAEGLYKGLEDQTKTIKAIAFNRSNLPSDGKRENDALASHMYREHLGKLCDARLDYLTLKTKRDTADRRCRIWQSLNKSQVT